jgi:radical SAM superfamily enzyme YgiQ (UPF0313 family)
MRITLIKPRIGSSEDTLYVDEARMEPLTLSVIAGLTPPDVDVRIYDDRMESIPFDEPTSLVGITVETWTARRAYQIADEYRRRGVPVILGGIHTTLAPEEGREHADSVFVGDAEQGWRQVVADAAAGALKPIYRASPGVAQSGGVRPARELHRGKGYLPIHLTQFSRGCPFACTFCAVSRYFDRRLYHRRLDEVVAEIAALDKKIVFFVDDNFTASPGLAKELCRALIPLKIRWVSQGSIDMTDDPELMSLMVESGCLGHVIGFESLDPEAIRQMGKRHPNRLPSGIGPYARQLEILRDHGLQTWAAFTFGHDTDTLDTVKRTLDWAIRQKFAFAAFNVLTPYPGTELYRSLEKEGRLLYGGRWWLHPEYRVNSTPFVPRRIDPETLTRALAEARRTWSQPLTILRRFLDFRTHLRSPYRAGVYWAYNPLVRREVRKKIGLRLGLEPGTRSFEQYRSAGSSLH